MLLVLQFDYYTKRFVAAGNVKPMCWHFVERGRTEARHRGSKLYHHHYEPASNPSPSTAPSLVVTEARTTLLRMW